MFKKFIFRFISSNFVNLLTMILVIIFGIIISLKPGLSQQADFRISNLQNDIRRLDLQLEQLELILKKNNLFPLKNSFNNSLNNPKYLPPIVKMQQDIKELKIKISQLAGEKS